MSRRSFGNIAVGTGSRLKPVLQERAHFRTGISREEASRRALKIAASHPTASRLKPVPVTSASLRKLVIQNRWRLTAWGIPHRRFDHRRHERGRWLLGLGHGQFGIVYIRVGRFCGNGNAHGVTFIWLSGKAQDWLSSAPGEGGAPGLSICIRCRPFLTLNNSVIIFPRP